MAIRSPAEPWRIGIEHPADPTGLLTVLRVRNGGVATSGSVHRGPHIIDPTSGAAASGIRQATVIGPSLTWADIWATAIVAAGNRALDAGSALITRCLADGYDALLVSDDGSPGSPPGSVHTSPRTYRPHQPAPWADNRQHSSPTPDGRPGHDHSLNRGKTLI